MIRSAGARGRAGGAQKRTLVIKPFADVPKPPPDFEDSTWERLRAAVRAVCAREAVSDSLESLYRAVEDLCAMKMGARLYERLRDECDAAAGARLDALAAHVAGATTAARRRGRGRRGGAAAAAARGAGRRRRGRGRGGERARGGGGRARRALVAADAAWRAHCESMLLVRSIFLYLDRTLVLNARAALALGARGRAVPFAPRRRARRDAARAALLDPRARRAGEAVPRPLARAVRMLVALGLYGERLEPRLLAEAAATRAEGGRLVDATDARVRRAR